MKHFRRILLVGASIMSCTVAAEEWSLTVVPAVDLAFKNNRYSVPAVDVDLKFKASFTTLVPSLTFAYGPIYASVNYDFTIADSEKYITGTVADPGFATIHYGRKDATITLGYRLHPAVNIFGGYTQGKGTLLLSTIDNVGVSFATTRVFSENGFYAGASYNHAFSERGALNLGAAYGTLDGLLTSAGDVGNAEIVSKAPGYSLNLAWIQAATKTLSYRIGVKYTSYTFEGEEYRNNGVVVPLPREFNYYEKITTFYIGVVDYF